jgi:hypothetical protein
MLGKEYQFYIDNRNSLIKKHLDKFIVIKGKRFIASYDTHEMAYNESIKNFPEGTFLIQHCVPLHAPLY